MGKVKSSLAEVALVQAVFVLEDFLEESGKKREVRHRRSAYRARARSKLGFVTDSGVRENNGSITANVQTKSSKGQ